MNNFYTTLSSIYILDKLINQTNRRKRTLLEIDNIVKELSPPNLKPFRSRCTDKGFIFDYANDKDINFIFHSEVTNKLTDNNLFVDLGKKKTTT